MLAGDTSRNFPWEYKHSETLAPRIANKSQTSDVAIERKNSYTNDKLQLLTNDQNHYRFALYSNIRTFKSYTGLIFI